MNIRPLLVVTGAVLLSPSALRSQEIALSLEVDEPGIAIPELPNDAAGSFVPSPGPEPFSFGQGNPEFSYYPPPNAVYLDPNAEFGYVAPEMMMSPGADMPGSPGRPCPWWRPCGPGKTWGGNWFFYQGAYGADFRPACANHDACLMNPYNSRYGCDRQFLDEMTAACMASDNPAACMHKAHKYYVLVRVFGVFYRW